jgi:hypothetical protein
VGSKKWAALFVVFRRTVLIEYNVAKRCSKGRKMTIEEVEGKR